MKKQLFSFLMVLALVVLAGTSAMAQSYDIDGAINTNAQRYVMVAGSKYTLSVVPSQSDNTFAWTLYDETGSAAATAAQATLTNNTTKDLTIEWSNNSLGNYYAQVQETRATSNGTCAVTTRRFYITIIDFDIYVYAADAAGEVITGATLSNCGAGTTARYGDMGSGLAFSNTFQNDATGTITNALNSYVGTGKTPAGTERYIGFQVIWNLGSVPVANAPTIGGIGFTYTAKLDDTGAPASYTDNADLVSVNGVASPTGTTFIATGTGVNTLAATDFGAGTAKGPTGLIKLVVNDRWSSSTVTNLALDFDANAITLYSGATEALKGTTLGSEPSTYIKATTHDATVKQASNKAEQQIIQLAPATSTITVVQN